MDIEGWLRGLGLERYEQAFRENEIDLRVLPELTADDLKELGVAAIGHRRLLLKAIADLAAGAGRAAAEEVLAASPANATAEAERRQLTVIQTVAPWRAGRSLRGAQDASRVQRLGELVERLDLVWQKQFTFARLRVRAASALSSRATRQTSTPGGLVLCRQNWRT
jgi:SAM domain (Sterile alpha motif)